MKSSREHILNTLKGLQAATPTNIERRLPDFSSPNVSFDEIFRAIGVTVHRVKSIADVREILRRELAGSGRWVTSLEELSDIAETNPSYEMPADLHDVGLFITSSPLTVAENGAVWLPESVGERVLPFIATHLAVIVKKEDIVNTMHDAYHKIGDQDYSFGCFIAGPSRTADIEQSLVLGAQGPVSMLVFILE